MPVNGAIQDVLWKKDIKDDIVFNKKKCSKSLSYFVKNETNETYSSNLASSFKKNKKNPKTL